MADVLIWQVLDSEEIRQGIAEVGYAETQLHQDAISDSEIVVEEQIRA